MRRHELALGTLILAIVLGCPGQERVPAREGAPGYGTLVAAMSRALGALSRDIATAIGDPRKFRSTSSFEGGTV